MKSEFSGSGVTDAAEDFIDLFAPAAKCPAMPISLER
jgi:hypothetical protein